MAKRESDGSSYSYNTMLMPKALYEKPLFYLSNEEHSMAASLWTGIGKELYLIYTAKRIAWKLRWNSDDYGRNLQ